LLSIRVPMNSLRLALAALVVGLAGCSTTALNPAPIVDRSERATATSPAPTTAAPAAAAQSPAATRQARDGAYTVQRGDTLYSIALAFGQDHRDLARWNGIEDPSRLAVGQLLRVEPPAAAAAVVPVAPVAAAQPTPLPPATAGAAAGASGAAAAPSVQAPAGTPTAPGSATLPAATPPLPAAAAGGATSVAPAAAASAPSAATANGAAQLGPWLWPAEGKLIEGFHATRNKGIDIAGKEGDPVVAAADGQVVYSGSGLRGYGNLVILKHGEDFISAYAHNRSILVKQGQSVRRGQRIAELGRTDADVPKLHFEIRQQGKPIDPLGLLPKR
jgi:lipoprotein NlpD